VGYFIKQTDSYFLMKAEYLDEAMKKSKLLLTPEVKEKRGAAGHTWRGKDIPIEKHYAWVDEGGALNAETFKKVAQAFRWDMDLDDNGDVYWIAFNGEKYGGDEMVFLNTIAPYVKKDSYIEMEGEEGERWKWYFTGETCEEHCAVISYPTLNKLERY